MMVPASLPDLYASIASVISPAGRPASRGTGVSTRALPA
jgi:hypothetical protein